eukprot:1045308-Heterocapsa_arctica.AAC.1
MRVRRLLGCGQLPARLVAGHSPRLVGVAAVATHGQRCSLLEVDAKPRQLVAVAAVHARVEGDVEDVGQVGEGLDVADVPEPG